MRLPMTPARASNARAMTIPHGPFRHNLTPQLLMPPQFGHGRPKKAAKGERRRPLGISWPQ
jgi:hypothetical protein